MSSIEVLECGGSFAFFGGGEFWGNFIFVGLGLFCFVFFLFAFLAGNRILLLEDNSCRVERGKM